MQPDDPVANDSKDIYRGDMAALLAIMKALREPLTGCPWDIEQDFSSIAPYTIEEAYEVADAIERGDMDNLREELGDLLLQVVYHAQMAGEENLFGFDDVVKAITTKLIRRHPHVFGDEQARSAGMAKGMWEKIKAEEKANRAARRSKNGAEPAANRYLGDVPRALPALTRALKLQSKAARAGFDWPSAAPVLDKIEEEISELRMAIEKGDKPAMEDELGDLLFSVTNFGRHLGLDGEEALNRANRKFISRFAHIEDALAAAGTTLDEASLDEMEALWQDAKTSNKTGKT